MIHALLIIIITFQIIKNSIAKVTMMSNRFKEVATLMRCSSGKLLLFFHDCCSCMHACMVSCREP